MILTDVYNFLSIGLRLSMLHNATKICNLHENKEITSKKLILCRMRHT